METRKVIVKRAFLFDRKPTIVGEIMDLPKIFAMEMCAANKAEFVKENDVKVIEMKAKAGSKKEERKNAE